VLPNLKILKVAYNNITKLEQDFKGLPVLCQANLTNNQISTISSELVTNTRCKNHNVPGKLEIHLDGMSLVGYIKVASGFLRKFVERSKKA